MLTTEQIEARYEGIGASEAASAANLSTAYYSARELYHVKRREIEPRESEPLLTFLGHQLEPALAAWYERETGRKVQRLNATQHHPDLDWMLTHIDRRCVGNRIKRGLEIKTRVHTDGWGPSGTDQVADEVLLQAQHQMAVMRWPVVDVICLFGGRDARIYTVPRDDGLITSLIDLEGELWHRIQVGDPPDFDYEHRATLAMLQKLHPATDGKVIELPAVAQGWAEALTDAREQERIFKAAKDAAEARIRALMGDAAVGQLPHGGEFRRSRRTQRYYNAEGEQTSQYMALSLHKASTTR